MLENLKSCITMNCLIPLLAFILIISTLQGQSFSGVSVDKRNGYQCEFRINKDSTINFIYHRPDNVIYAEYRGTIKRKNDSLFYVEATMQIGQFYMKSFDTDTFYIQLKDEIGLQLDKIEFEFSDKSTKNYQGYTREGKAIALIKVPIDKKKFSEKKGSDNLTLRINRKNFISNDFLNFKIPFGSAASFSMGEKIEFDVILQKGQLVSTGKAPIQTGHFKMFQKK
jgi:hypothetical protein